MTPVPGVAGGAPARDAAALAAAAWEALRGVKDPELPAVDVVELGIVRDVRAEGGAGPEEVTITPTFSACPALHVIEAEVRQAVATLGVEARVVTSLSPPWSSDDMSDAAREKLRAFGIAPPQRHGGLIEIALDAPVRCPRCGHPCQNWQPYRVNGQLSICFICGCGYRWQVNGCSVVFPPAPKALSRSLTERPASSTGRDTACHALSLLMTTGSVEPYRVPAPSIAMRMCSVAPPRFAMSAVRSATPAVA